MIGNLYLGSLHKPQLVKDYREQQNKVEYTLTKVQSNVVLFLKFLNDGIFSIFTAIENFRPLRFPELYRPEINLPYSSLEHKIRSPSMLYFTSDCQHDFHQYLASSAI